MKLVVGIGSNLGSRVALVSAAMDDLACELEAGRVQRSRMYRSGAVTEGSPPGPDFVNAAVSLEIDRSPEEVLAVLRRLEARYHRAREIRWGDRTLDLDALWADESFGCDGLSVPHPRLRERPFALAPLRDVAPEALSGAEGSFTSLVEVEPPNVDRRMHEVVVTGALDLADALAFGASRGGTPEQYREVVASTAESFVQAHGGASGRTVILATTPSWRALVGAKSGASEGQRWRLGMHHAGAVILRREPR